MARKSNKLITRELFYIITNGAQTENNYFHLLKTKHSIYDVKIIFQNLDPLKLVQFAQTLVKDANQVWCVFDIDHTYEEKRLSPALKNAKNNNIKIAYSNVAFEVWLISHFEKCKAALQLDDYETELNRHLSKKGRKYSKSDEKLLKEIFLPNYKKAIENAKIIYQNYVKDFYKTHSFQEDPPIWEWASSTTVYKLVEALKLKD